MKDEPIVIDDDDYEWLLKGIEKPGYPPELAYIYMTRKRYNAARTDEKRRAIAEEAYLVGARAEERLSGLRTAMVLFLLYIGFIVIMKMWGGEG